MYRAIMYLGVAILGLWTVILADPWAACFLLLGITKTYSVAIGGDPSMSTVMARTGDGNIGYEVDLGAINYAYGGDANNTLTTRTSDTAGTLTVETGHNIVTGTVFDLHWTASGVKKVAYGATAGTVSAAPGDTSIPFTGASGDVLPATTTQITFCKQISVNTNIDGDNLSLLGIKVSTDTSTVDKGAHIQFNDSGSSEIAELDFSTNGVRVWDITGGDANAFTGNPITEALVSHAVTDTSETVKLLISGVVDATP